MNIEIGLTNLNQSQIEKKNQQVSYLDLLFFVSPRSIFYGKLERRLHEFIKEKRLPIRLIKIDVTKSPEITEKYNVVACPALIFRDFRMIGNFKIEDFEELLTQYFFV